MLFISCDNWKTLLFIQTYCYPEVFCNHHVAAFFETSVLKEVHILCPLSPQQYYNAAHTKGPKLKILLFKFPQQILFLRMFTYILSFCVNVSHFSS